MCARGGDGRAHRFAADPQFWTDLGGGSVEMENLAIIWPGCDSRSS